MNVLWPVVKGSDRKIEVKNEAVSVDYCSDV